MTLLEMKEYLRVDGDTFDTTISSLIKAAREAAREYQNRSFFTQTWEISFDSFPKMPLKIPLPPLQRIDSILCIDSNGSEQTLNLDDFIVDKRSEPGRLMFKSGKYWPAINLQPIDSVIIRFTAGHNDINKVPNSVKLAYMVFITHRFEHPGSEDIPQAFYSLLSPERLVPA